MKDKCRRCGNKLDKEALHYRHYSICGECDREHRESKAALDVRTAEIKSKRRS